jgi:hypothetical protein
MNKKNLLISFVIFLFSVAGNTQSTKEFKAGHVFFISIPTYMNKTTNLNDVATIQFKSTVKDVYGFVIEDNKEEMLLSELTYATLNDYYEDFIKDFAKGEKKRTVSQPIYKSINGINFVTADLTYYDKDIKGEIYYAIGLVETKDSFYKVLFWSSLDNKDKFKTDFEKITFSLRD